MAGTYKAHLTAEQWARVCAVDDEIAVAVAKQQPQMAAEIGVELVTAEIVTTPDAPPSPVPPASPAVRRRKSERKAEPKSDPPPAEPTL